MNKLILVGNGFDLSLGLETHYSHFIVHFLKSKFLESLENPAAQRENFVAGIYNDRLIDILIDGYFEKHDVRNNIEKILTLQDLKKLVRSFGTHGRLSIKSTFFNHILTSVSDLGWVDIEQIYFDLLLECKNKKGSDIDTVNADKIEITKSLENYLEHIQSKELNFDSIVQAHKRIFYQPIRGEELNRKWFKKEYPPKVIYFLDFNYTSTISKLTKKLQINEPPSLIQRNDIHGKINSIDNPIIFGFGDEKHDYYKEIEDLNDNRYLDHIKSFDYLKTSNLKDLKHFLNDDQYQVCIYGHSCGLSDRIMLKEIFEHQNCNSIKIYYHKRRDGSDDFRTKSQDISRHFDSNSKMRATIVPWELSEELPQLT